MGYWWMNTKSIIILTTYYIELFSSFLFLPLVRSINQSVDPILLPLKKKNPIETYEEFLSLQPMFPDIHVLTSPPPLIGWVLRTIEV